MCCYVLFQSIIQNWVEIGQPVRATYIQIEILKIKSVGTIETIEEVENKWLKIMNFSQNQNFILKIYKTTSLYHLRSYFFHFVRNSKLAPLLADDAKKRGEKTRRGSKWHERSSPRNEAVRGNGKNGNFILRPFSSPPNYPRANRPLLVFKYRAACSPLRPLPSSISRALSIP